MGILKSARRKPQPPQNDSETLSFAAEIPVGENQPLWKIELQMHSEPQADGERVRLRAHLQTNLGSALRPALQAGKAQTPRHEALPHEEAKPARGLRLAQRTGAAVQELSRRALEVPLLRRLAEPLLQLDFNTWIEIQASTASLDAGASSLLPQSERLAALGIRPRAAGEQPLTETWAGETPDGVAQLSVLQLDRRHLPAQLLKLLGDRPFGLAATVVNTVQKKR
ncbi:hypothetical protein SAMN04488038_112105 [Solimonas aquatica]|uniref:Uncharacterized protein n=1 Tax=Solimonas aquatica TaxID=489703 RepID=A0A1H9JVY7_9GAMM|nr:hypothetical protein [Solimonas aquatica]SEQ91181.1 hypothetical protein SAMN04488038_112105 [Solimonas aquatica]